MSSFHQQRPADIRYPASSNHPLPPPSHIAARALSASEHAAIQSALSNHSPHQFVYNSVSHPPLDSSNYTTRHGLHQFTHNHLQQQQLLPPPQEPPLYNARSVPVVSSSSYNTSAYAGGIDMDAVHNRQQHASHSIHCNDLTFISGIDDRHHHHQVTSSIQPLLPQPHQYATSASSYSTHSHPSSSSSSSSASGRYSESQYPTYQSYRLAQVAEFNRHPHSSVYDRQLRGGHLAPPPSISAVPSHSSYANDFHQSLHHQKQQPNIPIVSAQPNNILAHNSDDLRLANHEARSVISSMRNQAVVDQQPPWTLFLGDISVYCTERELTELFQPFGNITEIKLKKNSKGNTNLAFGFIIFEKEESALVALKAMNGHVLLGRPLR